jgi:hypothetical protein
VIRARLRSLAFIPLVLTLGAFIPATPALAAQPLFGIKDQSFTGAGEAPSGSKPESKLWFNDGIWWGEMWSSSAAAFRIFRLNGTTWVDTGTTVDTRGTSHGDALWDGTKLYIASHDEATDSSHNTAGRPANLYRFSYDPSTDTYTPDAGFPATITTVATETMVIDKDSTGMLWATWTQGKAVKVAHTTSNDTSWSTPITLPVTTGATALNSDDVSSLVAFGGNRIGVMWSTQSQSHMYFSTHRAGDPQGTWSAAEAITSGSGSADDHINLKADSAGRVYAAVKTSFTASTSTLTQLLVRSTGGTWAAYRFGTVAESNTRPIVELDETNGVVHMYATGPYPGKSSGQSGGTIYEKTISMASPSNFAPGTGTPVIQDPTSSDMNNASSTKQNVSPSSGIVVIATNDTKDFYWHSTQSIGGGSNTTPTANATTKTTAFNTAATVNLSGSDPETCQLTFAIVTPPAHGTLSTITNNPCAAGTPNTDTGSVLYSPTAGYAGPDTFSYTVNDGTATSTPATASITVNANTTPTANPGSATAAQDGSVSVGLGGSDPETCDLVFVISAQPSHGTLGTTNDQACTAGSPNTDAATVVYTPTPGYSGADAFEYTVGDGTATSTPATVSLTISPNTAPSASDTSKTTAFGASATVTLTGQDAQTCDLTFTITAGPAHGSLDNPAGKACVPGNPNTDTATVVYTPTAGYSGPDSFTFTVSDGSLDSNEGTVSVTVSANQPPTANATSKSVPFQTPTSVSLSGTDAESCQLTFQIASGPAHGSLGTVSGDACTPGSPNTDAATVVYTPDPGYSGPDSFTYTVDDGTTTSVAATATLTVAPGGSETTLTLNPTADSYVSSSNLTGNYGTQTTMKVREGAGDSANPNYRTYLKFDVSGVGSSVTSLQLRLFVTDASSNVESVYVVGDTGWTETTITYSNAPAISGTAIGTTKSAPAGAYVTITLDPSAFPSGASTLTLALKSSATDSFIVSSREDPTNKPQLIITSH